MRILTLAALCAALFCACGDDGTSGTADTSGTSGVCEDTSGTDTEAAEDLELVPLCCRRHPLTLAGECYPFNRSCNHCKLIGT